MTNGCYRCIQNFTNFQAQQLVCINRTLFLYNMTILNIKDKIIEATFTDLRSKFVNYMYV